LRIRDDGDHRHTLNIYEGYFLCPGGKWGSGLLEPCGRCLLFKIGLSPLPLSFIYAHQSAQGPGDSLEELMPKVDESSSLQVALLLEVLARSTEVMIWPAACVFPPFNMTDLFRHSVLVSKAEVRMSATLPQPGLRISDHTEPGRVCCPGWRFRHITASLKLLPTVMKRPKWAACHPAGSIEPEG
jgi:hypothetical protein